MTKSILREYVQRIVLNEGISFNKLKSMSFEEVKQYANTHLQAIGVGSSRKAYRLSSRFVLKLGIIRYNRDEEDIPHAGIAQNRLEFETQNKDPSLLPRVHAHADDFTWIVSDLVRPINDESEFCKLAGVIGFKTGKHARNDDTMSAFIGSMPGRGKLRLTSIGERLAQSIDALIKAMNVNRYELDNTSQWGKTTDGRLVLLDSGMDSMTYDAHYD